MLVNIAIIFQYSLFQHTNPIPLHILVDFFRIRFSDSVGYAVAGEGAAAFFGFQCSGLTVMSLEYNSCTALPSLRRNLTFASFVFLVETLMNAVTVAIKENNHNLKES